MIKDFFGNEIEVGDEVACLYEGDGVYPIDKGVVTLIDTTHIYFKVQVDNYGFYPPEGVIVNTEKKHKEKAVEYHLSQMG